MIHEFLDTFALFQNSYFSGWLIAVTLAMIGVIVVARDQIFIGAAVAQASTLGIALAMVLGFEDAGAAVAAVAFAVLASVITARQDPGARHSHEAITGWVFLVSSSLSVLLMTHSPHGLEEVHRLLATSSIGATDIDVWVFGAIALVTALLLIARHRPILMLTMDETTAAAIGMNITLWGYALAAYLGLALGLSLRCGGMLYSFGCLILPALIARNLCRQVRPMFIVAPAIALVVGVVANVLSNHYDWPPAQATVAMLCLAIIPASLYRRWRGR